MIAEPISPPRMTSATAMRFVALSMWSSISSMPGFSMCTWNVPARSCSSTSDTWYGMSRATDASPIASARARCETARGWKRSASSPRAYGFATSKTLKSGIHLLPHRRERRDRLVQNHEATRKLEVHRVDELKPLPDHLDRVDVREPAPVVAIEEHLQLGAELGLASQVVAHAELPEASRDRIDVLRRGVDEEPRELDHVVLGELSRLAEVDETERAGIEDEDVGGMRVGVEEPVPEDHRHPGVGELVCDVAALLGPHRLELEIGDLRAAQELEREDPRGRVLADHARYDDPLVAREVPMERLGVPRLVTVVELEADRARELVDELLRIHELERLHPLLQETRSLVQEAEIGFDLITGRRPLHLYGNLLPVRQDRAMHLADRRRGDRGEVELEERTVHPQFELGFDNVANLLEGNGRRIVLKPAELGDDVRWNDVGSRGEELAELDEGRPELVEHHDAVACRGQTL